MLRFLLGLLLLSPALSFGFANIEAPVSPDGIGHAEDGAFRLLTDFSLRGDIQKGAFNAPFTFTANAPLINAPVAAGAMPVNVDFNLYPRGISPEHVFEFNAAEKMVNAPVTVNIPVPEKILEPFALAVTKISEQIQQARKDGEALAQRAEHDGKIVLYIFVALAMAGIGYGAYHHGKNKGLTGSSTVA